MTTMPMERWGTLSVKDHLDTQALIADLLLYDRLVFPIFSGEGERTHWRGMNWDPDGLEGVIADLGADVAVKAEWDESRRQRYKDLRKARKQIAEDAYQTTRRVLTMDLPPVPGITEVRAVAAYHDEHKGRQDLGLTTAQPDEIALGKLAFVISQRLLVPLIDARAKPRDLMLRARDLSLDLHYRDQRQEFYLLQENAVDALVRGRQTISSVVDGLKQRADALNHPAMHYFSEHWESFTAKTVLTVVGISLPFVLDVNEATGLLGFVPGGYELVKFGAAEVVESKAKAKCEAAAMVVSAQKVLR
ncbi:hypothetical protein [Bradyrhizobium barranii]